MSEDKKLKHLGLLEKIGIIPCQNSLQQGKW